MSESNPDANKRSDDQRENHPSDASIEERLRRLENDLAAERKQRRELEERVDELESRPTVELDSGDINDLTIEAEDGSKLPLGRFITAKAGESDVEWLEEKVEMLLEGEADVVVRGGADGDAIPVENAVGMLQAGQEDELSANKQRAAMIFPKFGGRAETWGQKMKLDSNQVRQILEEKTGKSADAWNRNTVHRAMRQLAKLTSDVDDASKRDPFDEDANLIHVRKGEKRTQLVADRDEWQEFCDDVASS